MAFSFGNSSVSLEEILNKVSEFAILQYYLGVTEIPTIMNSPLRRDNKPSFGLYTKDGKRIFYKDLATKETGGLLDLLKQLWGMSLTQVINKLNNDLIHFTDTNIINSLSGKICIITESNKTLDLQCQTRDWEEHDITYWESYGVSLFWLKYADVYPISHKIIVKTDRTLRFKADKHAYAFVEHKEGKVTLKIYQPYNKEGYKWSNKHDRSVISLWTKIPEYGQRVCICSSLKDALCLSNNLNIPTLATQGEGYAISEKAIFELKRRYKEVYILFDNDKVGLEDGIKLANETGFTNLVLPNIQNCKDISDLYFTLQDPKQFKFIINNLFKNNQKN